MPRHFKNKTANIDSMDCINPQGIYLKGGTATLYAQSEIGALIKKEDDVSLRTLIPIVYTTRLEDMVTFQIASRKSTPADFYKNVLNESKPKFKGFVKTPKVKEVPPLANQEMLEYRKHKTIHKSNVELHKMTDVKKSCRRPIITIDLTASNTSNNTSDITISHESLLGNILLQNYNPSRNLAFLGADIKKNCFNQTSIQNQAISSIFPKPIDCLNKENTLLDLQDNNLGCERKLLNKFPATPSNNVEIQSDYRSMLLYERSDIKQIIMFWEYNHRTYCLHRLRNYTNPSAALFQYTQKIPFKTKKTFCCWYKENSHFKEYFPQTCLGVQMLLKSSHKCVRDNCSCCCNVSEKLDHKPESSCPILQGILTDHSQIEDFNNEILLRLLTMKMKLKLKSTDMLKSIPQDTIMYKALNFNIKRTYTFSNLISRSKHGIGPLNIIRIDHQKTLTTEYYKIGIKGDVLAHYKFVHSENNVTCDALQSDLFSITDISQSVCCWFKRDNFISNLKKKIALSPAAVRFMKKRHLCSPMCSCCCRPKRTYRRTPRMFLQTREHLFKEIYDDNNCLRKLTDNGHVSSTTEKVQGSDYSMSEIAEAFANSHKSDSAEINNFIHTILEKFKNIRFKMNENGRVAACIDRPASDLSNDELNVMSKILYFAQCHLNKVGTMPDATFNVVTFNLNKVGTMSDATFNVNTFNLNKVGTIPDATPFNDSLNTSLEKEIDSPCETAPTLPSVSKETNKSSGCTINSTVIRNSISDQNEKECVNEYEKISNVISSMKKVNQFVISSFCIAQETKCRSLQHSYVNSIKQNSEDLAGPVITKVFSLADEVNHENAKANNEADAKNTIKAMKRKGDNDIESSSNKCFVKELIQDMNFACSDLIDLTDETDVQILNDNYSFDVPRTSKRKM